MAMDVWKRMTVAGAVLVIVTLALTTVHALLTFWQAYAAGLSPAEAALAVRVDAYPAWLAVTLIAVMLAAVLWARSGKPLTVAALVVASVSLLVLLGFGVFRAAALAVEVSALNAATEIVLLVATMILPIVSIVVLVRLLAATRVATAPGALPPAESAPAAGAPVWKPDQAAGAHWQTAGAAASGAAAQNWGRPGERGGWSAGAPTAGALPAGPSDQPGSANEAASGTAPQPVHQPRPPGAFGPQALAQQYGSSTPESATAQEPAIPPTGRREPPRWTPLDRPSGQDPS